MVAPEMEHVTRQPHPRLRPFIESYTGYRAVGLEPGVHAGLPSRSLTLIIAFDDPVDTTNGHGGDRTTHWGMIAGLHSAPAAVTHSGRQHGIQLGLTPRGASAVLGAPSAALARRIEHLDDVAPAYATELVDRVSAASNWRTRWAIIDEIFLRVLQFDREMPQELERAWSLLTSSHGLAPVSSLAEQAGWSRRHFTKRFKDHYGLTPKTMARVIRFERAQRMIRLPTRPALSAVAAACGYADQAHMTREWVEFAGSAPTTWLDDEWAAPVDDPFVQDQPPTTGDT